MKKSLCIIAMLAGLSIMAACRHPVEAQRDTSPQQPYLSAIDSLMWHRPDSALACLLDHPMDDPYYQLLLSEALYKNDATQANRQALLAATAYFDSVGDAFLSARCHYMNGAGYYETDSVAAACAEYLKALEVMEDSFEEKDLVGYKAKFMALTYTHVCQLFSDQYLHEQAIHFGKCSLPYYHKYNAEPWHVAWILREMGSSYFVLNNLDSADYYYSKAMATMPDTNNLNYRDISTVRASLSYHQGENPQTVLKRLMRLLIQAESDNESLSRCSIIGEVYYQEKQYDSAWVYLNLVFHGNSSVALKKQAAEWLVELSNCKDADSREYADFLVPFANQEENTSEIKSQITKLYGLHIQNRQERLRRVEMRHYLKRTGLVCGSAMLVILASFMVFHHRKKRRFEEQITEERLAHEAKQKAMGGRLRESNEALRTERKEKEELLQMQRARQSQLKWDSLNVFLDESICQEIMALLKGKHIKRDSKSDDHPEVWLDNAQLSRLEVAVESHFDGFVGLLSRRYPKLNQNEKYQCLLCLLNLKDVEIAALLHSDYSTIKKRSAKMKKAFGTEKTLQDFIRELVL